MRESTFPEQNHLNGDTPKRVVIYLRTACEAPHEDSACELQKQHLAGTLRNHPDWKLQKIFTDAGISGLRLDRPAFSEMIKDCEIGNIDLVLCKSVSRFSRNVTDCFSVIRKLISLPKPVGIFFETEGLYIG